MLRFSEKAVRRIRRISVRVMEETAELLHFFVVLGRLSCALPRWCHVIMGMNCFPLLPRSIFSSVRVAGDACGRKQKRHDDERAGAHGGFVHDGDNRRYSCHSDELTMSCETFGASWQMGTWVLADTSTIKQAYDFLARNQPVMFTTKAT